MLGGRPSSLYEVDHIIPLWAGGADTNSNLQVLARPEHDKKTKAQAVAYTLLANREINENQAKTYALTWGDRDLSDIPAPKNGVIDLDVAKKIRDKWDLQQQAAPKITAKDFFAAIPTGVERAFDFTEATKDSNFLLKSLAKISEGLIKGVISGVTAGWVPYSPQDDAGLTEKASGIVGNIAGMLVPIGAVSKGFRVGGLLVTGKRGAEVVTKGNWLARVGSRNVNSSAAAKSLGLGMNALNVATKVTVPSWAKRQMSKMAYTNLASNTAAITLYGQATPEAVENRMGRFWEDLAFGVLAPLAGGVAGARFGSSLAAQTTAESLAAGATAGMISFMSDSEHPVDALINAGMMAALHGVSVPGLRKHQKNLAITLRTEQDRMANNIIHTYLPERTKLLGVKDNVSINLTRDEVITLRGEAMKKLDILNADGKLSPEAFYAERRSILAATSVLENTGLKGARLKEKTWNDLVSLAEQTKRLGGRNITEPAIAQDVVSMLERKGLGVGIKGQGDSFYFLQLGLNCV